MNILWLARFDYGSVGYVYIYMHPWCNQWYIYHIQDRSSKKYIIQYIYIYNKSYTIHIYILYVQYFLHTIWLFNIAMENGPFMMVYLLKWWFSMAMLNNQMVVNVHNSELMESIYLQEFIIKRPALRCGSNGPAVPQWIQTFKNHGNMIAMITTITIYDSNK